MAGHSHSANIAVRKGKQDVAREVLSEYVQAFGNQMKLQAA